MTTKTPNQELLNLPLSVGTGDAPVTQSQLNYILSKLVWQHSQLNIRSGMNQYLSGNPGYFLGLTSGISGISDNTPVFSIGNPSGAYFAYNGTNLFLNGGTLLLDSTGAAFSVAYGVQSGTCMDGSAITFPQAYSHPPAVIIGGGGVTYDSGIGSASTQWQTLQAQNVTNTGFTPYLKIQSGGTQVAQSVNFGGLPTTISTTATLNTTVAYDNNYTCNFTIQVPAASNQNPITATATVSYSANGSAPFTPLGQYNVTNNTGSIKTTTKHVTFNVSSLVASTSKFAIAIQDNNLDTSQINTGATVTYTSGTPSTVHSATPTGTSPIMWTAIGITA